MRAVLDERLCQAGRAGPSECGQVERRVAGLVLCVWVGANLQQRLGELRRRKLAGGIAAD